MEKILTANGKSFNCDYFNPFPPAGQVNFRVVGASISEVATVISDP